MKTIDLEYTLSYQEAYEAFYVLASRRSSRTRNITACLLTAVAVVMLALFARSKIGVHYLFLAVCAIALLFYVLYQPVISAKRGASNVARTAGKYKIKLSSDGTIEFPDGTRMDIKGDKNSRTIETDEVFAMRIDQYHTVCIPKRILNRKETDFIKQIVS